MASFSHRVQSAVDHLRTADPVLCEIVAKVGTCTLRPKRDRFATLVHSIVAQQVSGGAAKAIFGRLRQRLGETGITAASLTVLEIDELRAVGVSRQKAEYLRDLARKTEAGELRFERFGRMPDEAIIEELVRVRGVGRWTAQMLLIFSLGRLDVLPVDDFGIRSAIRTHYKFPDLPRPAQIQDLAQPWRPYASIACWYLWRSFDS